MTPNTLEEFQKLIEGEPDASSESQPAIEMPTFTDEQIHHLINVAWHSGFERRERGTMDDPIEFVAGAMSVFNALGLWGKVPAAWTLGVLAGMKLFGLPTHRNLDDDEEAA